jgi:hypothetical protein
MSPSFLQLGIFAEGVIRVVLKRSGLKQTGFLECMSIVKKSCMWGVSEMASETRRGTLTGADDLRTHFSERVARLPESLQDVFFKDLETAIENRLKVLEAAK